MTRNKPYIVGLTGGIACGKSSVTTALRQAGAPVIDADEISRALTSQGGSALAPIRGRFGDGIFSGEQLDRKALADAVFGNPEALADLNAIMHPLVFAQMEKEIERHAPSTAVVLDVPLLYETGYDRMCDEVWCVWAPPKAQMDRLTARGLTETEAQRRMDSQMPPMEKCRLAQHVLVTTGPKAETARLARLLWDGTLGRVDNG